MTSSRWVGFGLLFLFGCSSSPPPAGTPPAPPECAAPQTTCGQNCANLALDDLNCGSCGKACPEGEACANGACFPRDCTGMECDPASVCFQQACTNKACVGIACPSGEVCSQGLCVC